MSSHHEQTHHEQTQVYPMSRSEREVEEALKLKEWYQTVDWIDSPSESNSDTSESSRIEFIHEQMCEKWATIDNSWQDFNSPPPSNPKLKDVFVDNGSFEEYLSKLVDILNITSHVLRPDIDIPERNHVVSSLEEPLEAWHIAWIKMLIDESEPVYDEPDDTDDDWSYEVDSSYPMYSEVDEQQRILNLQPRQLFQDELEELENYKHRQELSRKGLGIVEKIMEEQKLNEGDYIEMCNIFKELYK
jgi:hypothetical protein